MKSSITKASCLIAWSFFEFISHDKITIKSVNCHTDKLFINVDGDELKKLTDVKEHEIVIRETKTFFERVVPMSKKIERANGHLD
jgi:hypothetical protein